jgi:predicted nucleic acid-binding Zn ribbon protein
MHKKPRSLGDILSELLQQYGIGDRVKEFDAVNCWAEVVGERVARHTCAKDVRDGALIVEVSSSAWRNELYYLKPDILVQINKRLGKKIIHDILFV